MIFAFNKIGDWSTKWALGVTFANGAVMTLSALAAALLPYRAKKLYEASPGAKYRFGATPGHDLRDARVFGAFMVGAFLFVKDLGWRTRPVRSRTTSSGGGLRPDRVLHHEQVKASKGIKVEYAFPRSRRSSRTGSRGDGAGLSRPIVVGRVEVDERARVVVIGGGITGVSGPPPGRGRMVRRPAVDKGELTSGSTAHAAGLVTTFNPSPTMMRFRRYSIELYEKLGVFEAVGSLRIASSAEQLLELRRGVSRARGIGLEVDLLSAGETLERMPAASEGAPVRGGVGARRRVPRPAHGDPCPGVGARSLGARSGPESASPGSSSRAARGEVVPTNRGRIECEVVVNAAGIWATRVAAMAGAFVPSTPVDITTSR